MPYGVMGILVNIGPGNGLLPNNIKPLFQSMLSHHQWGHLAFNRMQFHNVLDISLKNIFKCYVTFSLALVS